MMYELLWKLAILICLTIICTPTPLYFSQASQHADFIIILLKLNTQQGDPLGGMLFALAHLHTFHHIATTHLTCVFLSLVNDTHSWSCIKCSSYVFTIARRIISIKSFNVASEVHSLVSSRVGPFYITSF
jgi:hypothetical protein